jgi:hypothetical protein
MYFISRGFAKSREISYKVFRKIVSLRKFSNTDTFREICEIYTKFRINYFAKLFRYAKFSNTNTFREIHTKFREISYKLFREIVSLC